MKRFTSLVAAAAATGGLSVLLLGGVAAAATTPNGLPSLTLGLNGKTVTVGGTMQSGAVNVVSTVTGEAQAFPTLIRLNNGIPFSEISQAKAAVQSHRGDFNYLDPYGSIVFSAGASKGTSTAETSLTAGNYVALDLNGKHPTPAEFVVSQATHAAPLPTPGATITSIEFGFKGPSTLHDGELVRFQNDGFLVHMIQGIGVKNATAATRLIALLESGKDGQAMKLATSFPTFDNGLSPGGIQQEVIDAKPGVYVLACFMDTQDGREHTQLGMERAIRIVK